MGFYGTWFQKATEFLHSPFLIKEKPFGKTQEEVNFKKQFCTLQYCSQGHSLEYLSAV